MRKKFVIMALVFMLIANVAYAKLDTALISDAKQALLLMSYGEYKKALKKLDFSSNAPTATELGEFVDDNMPQILSSDVQSSVAVAFYNGQYWQICIPVEEPCYDGVTTFVLRSKNGESFSGMTAKMWYDVIDETNDAQKVIWQDEYSQGDMYIVADEEN